MILGIIGVYLLIGVICYILLICLLKGQIEEAGVLFDNNSGRLIFYFILLIIIMVFWFTMILWGLIDLLMGIYYFTGDEE